MIPESVGGVNKLKGVVKKKRKGAVNPSKVRPAKGQPPAGPIDRTGASSTHKGENRYARKGTGSSL